MNNFTNIQEILNKYNNFQECILENINFCDFGTTVSLTFNYIWDENKLIRKDLDKSKLIILTFNQIQEFHLENGLTEFIINSPSKINWGINEISLIRLNERSQLLDKYNFSNVKFHHISILWESKRQLNIIFHSIGHNSSNKENVA